MRMHAEIMDQAELQRDKLAQAVTLREQYHVHKGEIENMLKIAQEQIEAVEVLGVAVHTRLDRYKVCDTCTGIDGIIWFFPRLDSFLFIYY